MTLGRGKTPDLMLDRSRVLRSEQTEAEARLWHHLRAGRLDGHKFRRQVPIAGYIADFVCPQAKLIVELDGSQHAEQTEYDARRSAYLQAEGYMVLRFWNNDALANTPAVLEAILTALTPPLPKGERNRREAPGRGDFHAQECPLPAASPLSLSPLGRGEELSE